MPDLGSGGIRRARWISELSALDLVLEIAGDRKRSQEISGDPRGRSKEITGDHKRSQEISVDFGAFATRSSPNDRGEIAGRSRGDRGEI